MQSISLSLSVCVCVCLFYSEGVWKSALSVGGSLTHTDAAVSYTTQEEMNHAFHMCGTRVFLFVCPCCDSAGAHLWLFIGFTMMVGSLIDSIWILWGGYVVPSEFDGFLFLSIFLHGSFIGHFGCTI
uniref:Transmembrane protein 107 n=1 Tax=Salmo trutta TaxID=8032 RepID=A0A673Z072_SALTR